MKRVYMFSIFTYIMSRVTHSEPGLPMIIAICTSLPRQLLRPENAWYFYTDISAGSRGNLVKSGKNLWLPGK